MLISIDHGNKQIKTNRRTFVVGLHESDTRPPFGQNILHYNGKYYTLSEQRIPYMRDKTVDERYFILTLFAVAFELAGTNYASDEVADVQLAIGLPPAHYGSQYEKFENYFLNRNIVDFTLDEKPYSVYISKAVCFPQAYAAIMPIYQRIRQYPKVAVLDIGGFTADYASRLVDYEDGDRLFDVTKGFLYHEMKRISEQSGVKKIRIHDVRHSHASLLIELGTNILLVSERLGHEDVETTLEIYGHLYPKKDEEVAGRLDRLCA